MSANDAHLRPLPPEAAALVADGRMLEAIKLLRRSQGLSLTDAKGWIDAHLERNPALRANMEERQREARKKFFTAFLVIDAVIFAGVIYWFFLRSA